MNSRPFEERDLAHVSGWFAGVEWTMPGVEGVLPPLGVLVEENDIPLACGWLYTTDSSLAILAWTATNSDVSQRLQSGALDELVEAVKKAIALQGGRIKMLMVLSKSKALSEKLKALGFRTKSGLEQSTWILKD